MHAYAAEHTRRFSVPPADNRTSLRCFVLRLFKELVHNYAAGNAPGF
jgi:hypothetical protein